MDRVEATGIGVALVGHAALFAALSFGFAMTVSPPPLEQAMEVSFVEEVALDSAAPQPSAAPAASATPPAAEPV
ncbi:MAG TPA: cell envelope biogenesis protein TolA, partial [Allosphingosinicella sp.]|nr:cell envelope biogenesis protein TolA [Allosphingosinicella sp.]